MHKLFTRCNFGCRCILFIAISASGTAADTCLEPIARVVSTQGDVKLNNSVAVLDASICQSDTIFVGSLSRAAIVLLSSDTVLRIDQNTTLTLIDDSKQNGTLLDLLEGALNLLSPALRSLDIRTPLVNAAVEGTEFLIRVDNNQTLISVFEGLVVATNGFGSLNLSDGQSAVTLAGEYPERRTIIRPRDGVQWALYYPNIGVDEKTSAFTREAAELLSVGRVEEASVLLERSRNENPDDAAAIALYAIIAVTQNWKEDALQLAEQAVAIDPNSSAAYTALSYVQQSRFDIDDALKSANQAVNNDLFNAYAWARLAELQLSSGDFSASLRSAQRAVEINPTVSRTQTVLGFAHLTNTKISNAMRTFKQAIEFNSEDPLAWLGLGLAKIRTGDLVAGRKDIEVAAALDPNSSLIRSYLGKAYFEENRKQLDARQYDIAKELDPNDPTPWYYDAIRKQTINRPVDALRDLQKSIELNDNRAVYRSRLLIDGDLAGRSANLARIYSDMGFEQLALVQGWQSVNTDFGNSSGHRLLADSYTSQKNHQIAQVSELLLSQLRQPLLQNPATTKLNRTELPSPNADGGSPTAGSFDSSLLTSFNEYSSMFTQNKFRTQLSGYIAENNTIEEEIIFSGVFGNFSGSLNQFLYQTDGINENQESDQEQNIGTFFFQHAVTPNINWQLEGRYLESDYKFYVPFSLELPPGFPPELIPDISQIDFVRHTDDKFVRLGGRLKFSPKSDVILNITRAESKLDQNRETEDALDIDVLDVDNDGLQAEIQNLNQYESFQLISGFGYFQNDRTFINTVEPGQISELSSEDEHLNFYTYGIADFSSDLSVTLGLSFDSVRTAVVDDDQINPKLGFIWNPTSDTAVRGAAFRTIKRGLLLQRTIEPTSVAGFNQFYDDSEGTDVSRYGIAIDRRFNSRLYGGIELSRRDLNTPRLSLVDDNSVTFNERSENLIRSYLYWTPTDRFALSADYTIDQYQSDFKNQQLTTGFSYFHPTGYRLVVSPRYVDQSFSDSERQGNRFWTTDIDFAFKFPKRRGTVILGVRNAFKQNTDFQDLDLSSIEYFPDRFVFGKLHFSF